MRRSRARRISTVLLAALFTMAAVPQAGAVTVTVAPDPVLILKGFKTDPSALAVGAKFKLELSLDNVVKVEARNVVVTVGSLTASATPGADAGPQVVVLGSNTRYMGTVAGGATGRRAVFDLVSDPRSAPGPCSVPVTIQYDSNNGGRGLISQSVGLMLTRPLVFDVGSLTYPRKAAVGVPFGISVSVQNTNDFPVGGVSLSFTSAGAAFSSNETTVGTLMPGKSAKLAATGIARQAGTLTISMLIEYQDDYNQMKEIRRDISIRVDPKPAAEQSTQVVPRRPLLALLALFLMSLVGIGG